LVFLLVGLNSVTSLPCVSSPNQDGWELLSAPWTPFNEDGSLNLLRVPQQAAFEKHVGVDTVWVPGGMGQWASLTTNERKALAEVWVNEGKKLGLFVIVHVGSQSIEQSKELAQHAASIKADAISVFPPSCPNKPDNLDMLITWLKTIANQAPELPLFYYHFPGSSGVIIDVVAFLQAVSIAIPQFAGMKYVDSDLLAFETCNKMQNGKFKMFWAPEPKLQAMPYGATRFVLAECYYAPYLTLALNAWKLGDEQKAHQLQDRLNEVQGIIGSVNEGAKSVMKMFGIDLGPDRIPLRPIVEQSYNDLKTKLQNWGFFNTTSPC